MPDFWVLATIFIDDCTSEPLRANIKAPDLIRTLKQEFRSFQ